MAARLVPPIPIPDSYEVWAASDLHGQRRVADRLLARAGLTDGADTWTAPPGTALVVCGDVVDRGPDSVGLVRRLASLRAQAAAAGGIVAILEGNHEMQVLGGLAGVPELFGALVTFGGAATFASAGMRPEEWTDRTAQEIADRLDALVPDLVPTLWSFAPYATWRDVLFVHGGPVPFRTLEAFEHSAERLWIRDAFFASPDPFPDAAAWDAYREAGIGRVVFGHTPGEGPRAWHAGRALNIDTWKGGTVSLAHVPGSGELAGASVLSEPAEPRAIMDAPVGASVVQRLDSGLPAIVDAWRSTRPWQP